MEENGRWNSLDFLRLVLTLMLISSLLGPDNSVKSRGNLRDSANERKMRYVEKLLQAKLDLDVQSLFSSNAIYAYNVSGMFNGNWKSTNDTIHTRTEQLSLNAHLGVPRIKLNSTVRGEEGLLSIHLYDRGSYRRNIHLVQGSMTLIEGEQDSSEDSLSLTFGGFYFLPTGHLTLFSNTQGVNFYLRWLSSPATSQISIPSNYSALVGHSENGTNWLYLNRPRVRTEPPIARCLYQLDLDLLPLEASVDPEISRNPQSRLLLNGTGSLVSRNCATNIRVKMDGFSMDTNHILFKSRLYSFLFVLATFLECFVYIQTMQSILFTSTHTASMLSVAMMAAIDVLVAMSHSLLGVFFLGLFSSLYFVSFHKFFLFSVIEMRMLFIIWRSYHPEINATNYLQYQKQLSCLFICLYMYIIITLISLYSQHNASHYLVFLVYSFWVPQIWRSLSLGQRPPMSTKQILLITGFKLLLPLYIFFCPYNMVRMFTTVPIPLGFGFKLVGWVMIQVVFVMRSEV